MARDRISTAGFVRNLRRQRALITTLLVLAGALVLMHAAAAYSYRASFAPGPPLAQRVSAAQRARRLEPFNARYADRARLLTSWEQGAELLSAGRYNESVAALAETLLLAPPEPELIALYKRAQAIQALETNKKAHLQHGHEGPGGTLRPEDVER